MTKLYKRGGAASRRHGSFTQQFLSDISLLCPPWANICAILKPFEFYVKIKTMPMEWFSLISKRYLIPTRCPQTMLVNKHFQSCMFQDLTSRLTDPNAPMYMSLGGLLSDITSKHCSLCNSCKSSFSESLANDPNSNQHSAGGGVLQTSRCSLNPSSGGAHSWSASCSKVSKVQTV